MLSSCGAIVTEYEVSQDEEIEVLDYTSYLDGWEFPVSSDDLLSKLRETGLDWVISERQAAMAMPTDSSATLIIRDQLDKMLCLIFMTNLGEDNRNMNIGFGFNEQTSEEAMKFIQEELPLFWILAGKLFQAEKEITILAKQANEYFEDYRLMEQPLTEAHIGIAATWSGREGDIRAEFAFNWHPLLEMYVPMHIYLHYFSWE